jgi:ABC-2 type transport system permease protein
MSIATPSAAAIEPGTARRAAPAATHPFYWAVRRELWEHRSIYLAPMIVAGLVIFGFLIRIMHLPEVVRSAVKLSPIEQMLKIAAPFGIATFAICGVGVIVAFFYCLGALYNERRDRSILFWKSLPVSNVTTVLSKTFVPLVVLPVLVFLVSVVTQLIMLGLGSAVLSASHVSPAALWTNWPMLKMAMVLAYLLGVIVLWYAPICGWLLLVSSWARGMPILWAVLPPLGLGIAEKIAFDTSYVFRLIDFRLNGFLSEALYYRKGTQVTDPLALLTPGHFLASPGLWTGLVIAAALLAGATWLRRNREPI